MLKRLAVGTFIVALLAVGMLLPGFTCHKPSCADKKCSVGWHCEMQGGWADPHPVCVIDPAGKK